MEGARKVRRHVRPRSLQRPRGAPKGRASKRAVAGVVEDRRREQDPGPAPRVRPGGPERLHFLAGSGEVQQQAVEEDLGERVDSRLRLYGAFKGVVIPSCAFDRVSAFFGI